MVPDIGEFATGIEPSAADRVRAAVVEVARRLFSERGIHAVSVREIAREVGVSHTLLHLYFGSKEEIVRQVLTRYDDNFADLLLTTEDFSAAAGDVFRSVGRDPAMTRVVAAALIEGIIPHAIDAETKAHRALVSRLKAENLDEDELDPRILATALSSMVLGWAVGSEWLLEAVGFDEDTDYDQVVDQLAILAERITRSCIM